MHAPVPVRILVIEDDESIRATLADMLELAGYRVLQACDGSAGLAEAKRALPDIILSDVAMPGLDGFALLAALRADDATRAIPVIVISASVEAERMRHAMNLGAEDYLVKPFTEDEVLRSVRARLEKKALLDELDAFSHTVAHDLKNPIAALSLRAELLDVMWNELGAAQKRDHVVSIRTGIKRLASIVDELLLLAGVRRQHVVPRTIDMAPLVEDALGRLTHLVNDARIDVPAAWPVAWGHAPWVAEIWTNYVSNALKYGGTPPVITLGADPAVVGGRRRFWVQDRGPGLSVEQQAAIFKPFARVSELGPAKGHGLGLSIVRRIAEKLDGAVGVESAPGEGCRFWFELPAEARAVPPAPPV